MTQPPTGRLCRKCGAIYPGSPYSTVCPDCRKSTRAAMRYPHTCAKCGIAFTSTAPRSKYCPPCTRDVRRQNEREHKRLLRQNKTRKLGSIDTCIICGHPYTVMGGLQKYCPACRDAATRAAISMRKRTYLTINRQRISITRKHLRRDTVRRCKLCGTLFDPQGSTTQFCSDQCRREMNNLRARMQRIRTKQTKNPSE